MIRLRRVYLIQPAAALPGGSPHSSFPPSDQSAKDWEVQWHENLGVVIVWMRACPAPMFIIPHSNIKNMTPAEAGKLVAPTWADEKAAVA